MHTPTLGDLHARRNCKLPNGELHLGACAWEKGANDLEIRTGLSLGNRNKLVEFRINENYTISNTWFHEQD